MCHWIKTSHKRQGSQPLLILQRDSVRPLIAKCDAAENHETEMRSFALTLFLGSAN